MRIRPQLPTRWLFIALAIPLEVVIVYKFTAFHLFTLHFLVLAFPSLFGCIQKSFEIAGHVPVVRYRFLSIVVVCLH